MRIHEPWHEFLGPLVSFIALYDAPKGRTLWQPCMNYKIIDQGMHLRSYEKKASPTVCPANRG